MPLTLINNQRVLYVGTGRYIGDGTHGGVSDLSDPGAASGIAWLQSLYAIKDRNFDYGTAFRTGSVVRQTLSLSGVSGRNVTKNPVNWTVNDGWFLDFISIAGDPSSTQGGERVNLDPQLVLGTVAVVTNTPDPGGTCSAGGSSRLYSFDYLTGGYVGNTSTPVGMFLGAELAVGFSAVSTQSGMKAEVRLQSGSNVPGGLSQQYGGATLKRFSYRER
jgi:type IV pilus assembly protein PilY1